MSSAPMPAGTADAWGGATSSARASPSGVSVCTADVEHVFWQKTRLLRGSLSFGKSETNSFCFMSVLPKVLIPGLLAMVLFGAGPAPPSAGSAGGRGCSRPPW